MTSERELVAELWRSCVCRVEEIEVVMYPIILFVLRRFD